MPKGMTGGVYFYRSDTPSVSPNGEPPPSQREARNPRNSPTNSNLSVSAKREGHFLEHIFIINPAAGKSDKTRYYQDIIESECGSRGLQYRIAVSRQAGDCTRIAREAAQTGEEVHLYACGGDGTLNEVVAGAAGFPNAAVTSFAGGSGNDFVKIFDDPGPFRELSRLLDYEEAEFDLIDCNGDYAVNICSVGLDARIGTDVAAYKRLPGVTGSGAYILSTLVNTCKGISEHYVVEVEGEQIDANQTMICVANGRFYGGGFNPVPEADPSDGLLDVLLVKKLNLLQVAAVIGKYKKGLYATLPQLVRHIRTNHIKIICDKLTAINLDGELRRASVVDMKITDKKIRFFYPRGLNWKPAAVKK